MNREIKFRAWNFKMSRMFSAEEMTKDQMALLPTGNFINVSGVSTKLSIIYPDDVMVPMQFTGLRDKNGKEIYEGDIVIIPDTEFELVTDYEGPTNDVMAMGTIAMGEFGWKLLVQEGAGGDYVKGDNYLSYLEQEIDKKGLEKWEVIGNIYESKELLK